MPSATRLPFRARWVPPVLLGVIALVVVLVIVLSGSAPTVGYDVSYPQCAGALPSNPQFGIVGVNGGVATTVNPCLETELRWARATPGRAVPTQSPLSLYLNTGNPGVQVSDWPRGGTAPVNGACNGQLTNACSYLYGEQRAVHSYRLAAAIDPRRAATVPWWLDVELMSSWAGTYALNIAALQGFIAGLRSAGAQGPVGIYSTAAQWKDLTGLTAQTTATVFSRQLPDWVAGTVADLTQARQNCTSGGFTGAAPTLAQYRIGPRDADLRCSDVR